MNRNVWLLAVGVMVLGVVVALGFWLREEVPVSPTGETGAAVMPTPAINMPGEDVTPADLSAIPAPVMREDVPLPPLPESQVDAAETLLQSRLHGDARAPAVVRSAEREPPTAAELATPEAYQRYEARQNERLYRSYVKAADGEIPKLQEQIAKGKAQGLTPEQIAEGEEKLRRIEAMRNQLMSDHPELNRPVAP